jgi:hypothetical protein
VGLGPAWRRARTNRDVRWAQVAEYRYVQARKLRGFKSDAFCQDDFEQNFNGTVKRFARLMSVDEDDLVRRSQAADAFSHSVKSSDTHVHRSAKDLERKERLRRLLAADPLRLDFLNECRVLMDASCVHKDAPPVKAWQIQPRRMRGGAVSNEEEDAANGVEGGQANAGDDDTTAR